MPIYRINFKSGIYPPSTESLFDENYLNNLIEQNKDNTKKLEIGNYDLTLEGEDTYKKILTVINENHALFRFIPLTKESRLNSTNLLNNEISTKSGGQIIYIPEQAELIPSTDRKLLKNNTRDKRAIFDLIYFDKD